LEAEIVTNQDIAVELEERSVVRKGLNTLRNEGKVPAVIHDHGKESIHVMGDFVTLSKIYAAAGKHHPVQLKVAGKQHLALIKDVDYEPTKHRLRHLVFQAIKQNEETTAEIPVVFAEDVLIPAEKLSLLVLKQLDHVEVKALPRDLPDQLVVDPSSLAEVGDSLSVADLKVPAGVTILTDPEVQIAIVEMPKDQIAAADEAQAELLADAGQPSDAEEAEDEK
jgi:large subunit ribosomal protein L25